MKISQMENDHVTVCVLTLSQISPTKGLWFFRSRIGRDPWMRAMRLIRIHLQ